MIAVYIRERKLKVVSFVNYKIALTVIKNASEALRYFFVKDIIVAYAYKIC